jgi:hypothetical protein
MKDSNFSHDFFDKWTEQSAYILGFWYADGCIAINKYNKNNKCYAHKRFNIINTDQQIMNDISFNIGVTTSTIKARKENWKRTYHIQVNSNKFFDFCYSFVGSVDKTHSLLSPFYKIPDEFLHHFVRGFFDGDGSMYIKSYKSRHGGQITNLGSSFSASKESWVILNDLKQILINKLGIGNKKITKCKSNGFKNDKPKHISNSKLIFNQYDTMLLCEWMYKDATIFMKRKKDIWDGFDKEKLKNSIKYFSNKV